MLVYTCTYTTHSPLSVDNVVLLCVVVVIGLFHGEEEDEDEEEEEKREGRTEKKPVNGEESRHCRAAGQARCCMPSSEEKDEKKEGVREKIMCGEEKRMPSASRTNASVTTNGKPSIESSVGIVIEFLPFSSSL